MYYPWTAPKPYTPDLPEPKAPATPLNSQESFLTRLETPDADSMLYASNYDVKDSHYGCHWRGENVEKTPSGALLAIHRVKGASQPCTAAEMQTAGHYSYGRYEVIMRPARGSGLVSSFFTYTGGYFGDPHDEIDIEFLGKDTTRIHFNYFRKGKTGADEIFDLPFDAADADRLYAFEWTPEGITWFVEGVPYYTTPAEDSGLPVAPGRVYMNVWAGEPWIEQWTGTPTYRSGAGAHYSCVSFVPLGQKGAGCGDDYTPPAVLSP
ncbi:putative licheninase [Hyphomonas neptunium ATCC 15444]|uniref:Beta-glucanase n=2 Tax=Hyphomonas TaxID=85 RepID=Q0BZ01_HYPNA|nr:putative licheninase [Hyphomonas neptunium ATCC 15444]